MLGAANNINLVEGKKSSLWWIKSVSVLDPVLLPINNDNNTGDKFANLVLEGNCFATTNAENPRSLMTCIFKTTIIETE